MEQLERTAYHEAGHALVADYFGMGLKEISIESNICPDGRRSNGHCEPETWANDDEANAIYCLAGAAAVKVLLGKNELLLFTPDFDRFLQFADKLGKNLDSFRHEAAKRAEQIIEMRQPAVKALAAALLESKTLNGVEAREIMRLPKTTK